jgi:hypothetical protein
MMNITKTMLTVLGLNPVYVIAGAAAFGLLLVVFVATLAGPATIVDGAIGLLTQSMATASATLGTMVAQAGDIVTQGMTIPTTIVSQAGMIVSNAMVAAASIMDTVFSIAATAVASAAQIVASVVATAAQIVAGGAAMIANIVISGSAAIASIYFAVQSAIINLGVTLVTNAIMALGQFYTFLATAAAQIIGSVFSGLSAILGQVISIPMIMLFGFVSVGTTIAGLIPQLAQGVFSVFSALFNLVVNFFIGGPDVNNSFLNIITKKLPAAITNGFTYLVTEFPTLLKNVLFGG